LLLGHDTDHLKHEVWSELCFRKIFPSRTHF
jgi:hypothetical protein